LAGNGLMMGGRGGDMQRERKELERLVDVGGAAAHANS
jgi:hypothetical protein